MSERLIVEKRFEQYRLEIWPPAPALRDRLRLFCGEEELEVEQRTLEVLEQLLSHDQQTVVLKQHIIKAVWVGPHGRDNIDTHICALRDALNDKARKPHFIETVHGKGYRFLVKWEEKHRSLPIELPTGMQPTEEQIPAAFDEFFGDGISAQKHDGIIIVQSDLMDEVLKPARLRREITQPSSRMYKAREWVNTWDVNGATAIQEEFLSHRLTPPKLILTDRRTRDISHLSCSFKILMGLGFTDETTKAIQNNVCGPWMHISWSAGEAVCFHDRLLKGKKTPRFFTEADKQKKGFHRLLPVDWSPTYMDSWLRMLPPINGPAVSDYAIIFRHTRLEPHRQVLFVVAGFTERGTAVAGKYLARKWMKLWEKHVRGRADRASRGDFLIMIEGPSDPQAVDDWSEVKDLEATPQKLHDKRINCEWADRVAENQSQ